LCFRFVSQQRTSLDLLRFGAAFFACLSPSSAAFGAAFLAVFLCCNLHEWFCFYAAFFGPIWCRFFGHPSPSSAAFGAAFLAVCLCHNPHDLEWFTTLLWCRFFAGFFGFNLE
jgi:hypothetical protein